MSYQLECSDSVQERLRMVASRASGKPLSEVHAGSDLLDDLGLDSLALTEFVMDLEDEFGIDIPDEAVRAVFSERRPVLGDFVELISRAEAGQMKRVRKREPQQSQAPDEQDFTQLGGSVDLENWLEGPLYSGAEEPTSTLRRCTDGMTCVLVPPGSCKLGGEMGWRPFETLVAGFLLDIEPVSVLAYCRFLNSLGPLPEAVWAKWFGVDETSFRREHMQMSFDGEWRPKPGAERQPVVLVSWYGANAYGLWAHRRDWRHFLDDGRLAEELLHLHVPAGSTEGSFLPSEIQWEYAARGSDGRTYPWGKAEPDPQLACYGLSDAAGCDTLPMPNVNARLGLSPFGLRHMAGTVWHWCDDWFAGAFQPGGGGQSNSICTGARSERGGSWVGGSELLQSSVRRGRPPAARGRCLGFRCSAPLPRSHQLET